MRNVDNLLSTILLAGVLTAGGGVKAGEVPKEILDGAAAATKVLGAEVVKGNFSYPIQKMYPRFKERAAKRAGGMEKLVAKLQGVPKQMQEKGITMLSFTAGTPTSGHAVRGVMARDVEGREGKIFREWLVFVPTTTLYRVIDRSEGTPKVLKLETYGFQVAICDGEKKDWSFIDGSSLTVSELRSFFPSLPEDKAELGMPEVGGKEVK